MKIMKINDHLGSLRSIVRDGELVIGKYDDAPSSI